MCREKQGSERKGNRRSVQLGRLSGLRERRSTTRLSLNIERINPVKSIEPPRRGEARDEKRVGIGRLVRIRRAISHYLLAAAVLIAVVRSMTEQPTRISAIGTQILDEITLHFN